jgi:glutaredoxin 3
LAHSGAAYKDVTKDPAAMEEMLAHSGGKRRVPVIVDDGQATVGYDGGS